MERRNVISWRVSALKYLAEIGFDGVVLIPEDEDWSLSNVNYRHQTRWEWAALDASAVIVFWVPRDFSVVPKYRFWRILEPWLKKPLATKWCNPTS